MAEFIVTNNNDSGKGSLRQAILDANNTAGRDRILVSGFIKLKSAIEITDSVAIVNVGKTIITQKGSDRLFDIDDGDADKVSQVNFVGIGMTGGNTEGSGGAIFSREDLGLFRSNITGNISGDRGGAVYVEGATLTTNNSNILKNQARTGGGVALAFGSQANLANSKISGNTAADDGGGIASSYGSHLELSRSEISGNTASDGAGISAYYNSSVKLANATVSSNTAEKLGGGISAVYSSQVEVVSSTISGNKAKVNGGIGIADSTLTTVSSEVANNTAKTAAGIGLTYYSQAQISDSNISGNTATKGDAGGISVSYFSSLKLDTSDVANNTAAQVAGGIKVDFDSQAVITKSTISGNQAQASGGINIVDNSSLFLVESQVSENIATKFQAGGIGVAELSRAEITDSNISNNQSIKAEGGGINVDRESVLKLENTLVAENSAADFGGGINADNDSLVEVADSTVEKNTARIGGGLNAANGSSLLLENVGIKGNIAIGFGGGVNAFFGSKLELNRSQVTGNSAPLVGGINIANGSSGTLANSTVANNVGEKAVGGINVYVDSQLEVFNTSITGNTNGGIQSGGENNVVTLISSPVTNNSRSNINGDEIRNIISQTIEAEDINNLEGYRLETNSLASGGQLLSLVGENHDEVGTANFNFMGETGNYTVKIGTYDENDGEATIQLAQQGNTIGSIVLDENLGGSAIANETKVTKVIAANILITQGDSFSLTGLENGSEHARIDFIEFEAVNQNGEGAGSVPETVTPAPTPTPDPTPTTDSIRWEAEAADSLMGYRTESIAGASGGSVLSLLGEVGEETGSASFTVGNAGTYDILLAGYDENDGVASFNLALNGSQVGDTLVLDQDLGSNLANTHTAVREMIAFGVSLEAGDILTVTGWENSSEHARLDYLELIPSELV